MKSKHPKIKTRWEKLIRMDIIRLLKLLEYAQYAILAAIYALIAGPLINNYVLPEANENANTINILAEILIEIGIIGGFIYYIKKAILLIPFLFQRLHKKYIPSFHGESGIAIALGLGIIFNHTQTNLIKKIDIIIKRYNEILNEI